MSENSIPDQVIRDQNVSDQNVPDQNVPDQNVPDQNVPDPASSAESPGEYALQESQPAVVAEPVDNAPVGPETAVPVGAVAESVVPKLAVPKLVGTLQIGKLLLFEGSKGLLYLGAVLFGLYGLTQGSHPAGRLVSGLILLVGALAGSFWPAEFKKYVAWFELDGEWFKYRLFRQRKKQKIAVPSVRARSRSSRGERYACTINVGDYEEIIVMFRYVSNGRELWERLQGQMAERTPEE